MWTRSKLFRHVAFAAAMVIFIGVCANAQDQPAPDRQIQQLVQQRLAEKHITDVDVFIANGIVRLQGVVPSLWAKNEALEQAHDVRGVQTVVSELTIARGESDERIGEQIAERIRRYVFFTIFDDARIDVNQGVVTFTGRVTMPYKADAFVDLASRVTGVQEVRNQIRTLPTSINDDQLRYTIARRIYGDPLFWNYAIQVNPPIHIIVEHARVTLTGVVLSEVERRKAEVIARSTFGVLNVENMLRLEDEPDREGKWRQPST